MFKIQRILFPVDFSDRSRGAAPYVRAMAMHFCAEVILLHVIEPSGYDAPLSDASPAYLEDFDRSFAAELKPVHVRRLIERGEAAGRIVASAATHEVDLIMMPTQGVGIYRRLIIGSSTTKVLHDADCPVWTGVHLDHVPSIEAVRCKRILCAVDLKPSSARVLDWAHHLATAFQAELTLLHAGDDHPALEQLLELQSQAGSNAGILVEPGEPAKVVAREAAKWKADLVVIGRRAETGLLGRLEMTAYSIIRQSPCPVVSV